MTLSQCSQKSYDPERVSVAELGERAKPRLTHIGGIYHGTFDTSVHPYRDGLWIDNGTGFLPLKSNTIPVIRTGRIVIRENPADAYSETYEDYEVLSNFPTIVPSLGAASYAGSVRLTLSPFVLNLQVRYQFDTGAITDYDPDLGIYIDHSVVLRVQSCSPTLCSAMQSFNYTITPVSPNTSTSSGAELTVNDLGQLLTEAKIHFNQHAFSGLYDQIQTAKNLLLLDPTLISDTAKRQRFIAQDSNAAADALCTTVARYLYLKAWRTALASATLPALPDFPHYYLAHVNSGAITTDSGGLIFVWVMAPDQLITPYVSKQFLQYAEFARSSLYPTDYSLLAEADRALPRFILLRDSPSAIYSSHTFFAVKQGLTYVMVDTYHLPFNGISTKGSAGQTWPYDYRFGPLGSRYLHYVYWYGL